MIRLFPQLTVGSPECLKASAALAAMLSVVVVLGSAGVEMRMLAADPPAGTPLASTKNLVLDNSGVDVSAGREIRDWPAWRGPDFRGTVAEGPQPLQFGGEAYRWRVELPGKGSSTPIVQSERIYLTAPVEGRDAVLCYDAEGKQVFQTVYGPEDAGKHRRGSGSNASPVTDGHGLFVYFKSGTLAALDLSGEKRWDLNLVEKYGRESLYWDHGTSPVLTEKHVVMARIDERDSWLAAFDKASGELAWKVERNYETPKENDHGYTTPLVIEHDGQEAILTWGAEHITIHAAADGRLLWSCGNFNPQRSAMWPTIASPVIVDEMVVVAFGRADRRSPRLFGVRLTGSGDVTRTNHVWDRDDVGAFVPTPLVHDGKVIVLGDRGDIHCLDPETGETIWQDRFPQARANFYASPLLIGDHLYTVREDGTAFVSRIVGRTHELLAENEMGQAIIGSPVPFGDGILFRGDSDLFFVGTLASE
jgi:outer membrane protein assembly factor BamB